MPAEQGCVYVGIAGDTAPGFARSSGIYRSRGGNSPWESIGAGIDPAPQVRTIAVERRRPGRVTIGTQSGIYRSEDQGDSWTRLGAPAPELAVWSLLVHPANPDVMLAGYEPCAIHRTADDGATWQRLPLDGVVFPDVTLRPTPQPKRVTGMAVDPANPDEIYASIEVGGVLRSLDGGKSWAGVTDGLYVVDDAVDLHRIVVGPAHPGVVNTIARIGMFRSEDRGVHWRNMGVPSLAGREAYCRDLVMAPDDPDTFYLGAGTGFDGNHGAAFETRDNGRSWRALDLGTIPRSTVFGFAADAARPERLYCAAKLGEAFWSHDRGRSWRANPLPSGVSPIYTMAAG